MNTTLKNTLRRLLPFKMRMLNVLVIASMSLPFSGCFDGFYFEVAPLEIDLSDDYGWKAWPGSNPRMTIGIDSIRQINDSTLRLFNRLRYDSVVIRSAYGVSYVKTGATLALVKIFQIEADTLDLRKLTDMNYSYDLDLVIPGIESNVNYTLCPFIDYIVSDDTIRFSGSELGGRCSFFETK